MENNNDLATIALLEYINAVETGIYAAKRIIKEAKVNEPDSAWNPEKIKWQPAEGAHGAYERSEDINNSDFRALSKTLAEHQGRLLHEGYFYWKFKNGLTVGRKARQKNKGQSQ